MSEILDSMRAHLLPLYILGADINKIQEPVNRPKGYPSYQLSLCLEGSGIFTDEKNITHTIEPGDLFFFAPNTPHKYEPAAEVWKLPYIVFTGHSAANIADYLGIGNSLVLKNISDTQFGKINVYFNKIYDTYYSSIESRTARTSSMLYSLLVLISEVSHEDSKVSVNSFMQQLAPALNYIHRHACEDISVDDLADIVGVSAGRLSVLFKQAFGTTPAQTVRRYKLTQAKRLINTRENIKIKELAKMCGFTSTSYFVTAFKKEFGMSPTDYKQNSPREFFW